MFARALVAALALLFGMSSADALELYSGGKAEPSAAVWKAAGKKHRKGIRQVRRHHHRRHRHHRHHRHLGVARHHWHHRHHVIHVL